jgi:hypothetical protein
MSDFRMDHLSGEALKIACEIKSMIHEDKDGEPYGGGCTAFYSPEQWRERGEKYGLDSVLILCHDGGDLSVYCNPYENNYINRDRLESVLQSLGYWYEPCTTWYSAVYRL